MTSNNTKKVLSWDKPEKKMSTEEWKSITADSAPPGVYTPNMSDEDNNKLKAKLIKGKDPRVEIRKSFHFTNGKKYPGSKNYFSQVLVIVRLDGKEPNILFSTNGKIAASFLEFDDLYAGIQEAIGTLKNI